MQDFFECPRLGLATWDKMRDTFKYISSRPNSTAHLKIPTHSSHNFVSSASSSGVISTSGLYLCLKGVQAFVGMSYSRCSIAFSTVVNAALA